MYTDFTADNKINDFALFQDPVTRAINGSGWAVMVDQDSVQKAVDYFNSGEVWVRERPHVITKTRLFKYIEKFTTKKGKFLDKKILKFFLISVKT